jgi:hypothetical protein
LGKCSKTLINAGENTDVELPLQIFSNNTSIPIVLTENDSIINTVNIDEGIVKTGTRLLFLSALKNENEPIVIEYVPGKFKTILWNSLNKLKYYPIALLLIIVLFAGLVYNFTKALKWLLKTSCGREWQKKQHIKSGRHFLH